MPAATARSGWQTNGVLKPQRQSHDGERCLIPAEKCEKVNWVKRFSPPPRFSLKG
jgi:hypothetical protein